MYNKSQKRKEKQKVNMMAYIHLIGMNKLQNDLLLSFLKEKTGFNGKCIKRLKSVAFVQENEQKLPQFLLLDWTSVDTENIWQDIDSWRKTNSCRCFLAFYNVDPKVEIENLALTNNIQGLFYKHDPLYILPKGITAILNGDLWYSRKTLTRCILQNSSTNHFRDYSTANNLTLREREILFLMASGCSNKEVATKLNISVHTVKTHIYNIYKKIKVNSRFQAALWAAKYL